MKKLIFLLVISFMIPCVVSAEDIEMNVSSTPMIWLGDSFQITCNCTPPENYTVTGVSAGISGPLTPPDITLSHIGDGIYEGSWSPPKEGRYSITVTCSADGTNGTINSSETKESLARKMSLDIKEITPEKIYTDHSFVTLYVNLSQLSDSLSYITDTNAVEWTISLGGHIIDPFSVFYDSIDSVWVLNSSLDGIDLNEDTYPLVIRASFEGSEVSLQTDVSISEALDFEIVSMSPEKIAQNENVTIVLSAKYRDSDIFAESSFTLRAGTHAITGFLKDNGGKSLKFAFPDIDPGEYGVKVTIINDKVPETTISRDILCTVPISGKITNAEGKGMSGKITFIGDDDEKITLNNGKYSTRIVPGDYNIIIENMEEIKSAFFSGVYLDGTVGNFFRFDSLTGLINMKGIRISSAFAMEFDNYFDSIDVQVNYDAKKVKNEQALEVYTCSEWNFDARICNSEWIKITGGVDDVKNIVNLDLNHLSAFIVGEKEDTEIEATLNKNEYYLNEEIRILGALRTEGGSPITDSYVTITLERDTFTEKTNSQGVFAFNLQAPDEEGEYEMRIVSNQSSIHPIEAFRTLKVTEKKELSLLVPMEADLFDDYENRIEFSLFNSGQSVLRNVEISITGVPAEWLSYSPRSMDAIIPGETKKIVVRIYPSEPDETIYDLLVRVETDQLNESSAIPLRINVQETVKDDVPEFPGFFTSNMILDANDVLNTVSIILAFVVLFVVVFRSKSKRPKSFESSPHIERMLNGIKKEVMKGKKKPAKTKTRRKTRKE